MVGENLLFVETLIPLRDRGGTLFRFSAFSLFRFFAFMLLSFYAFKR